MRTLEKKFKRKGFRYVEVWRKGEVAIYRRFTFLNFRKIEHFEVIRIRVAPAVEMFGQLVPDREVYPSSENWGRLGFSCQSLDRAYDKVLELQEQAKAKA